MNLENTQSPAVSDKNQICDVIWFEERMCHSFSLLKGESGKGQTSVKFEITDGKDKWLEHIKISGIEREDGSGELFNIKGLNSDLCQVLIFANFRNKKGKMTFMHK